MAHPWIHTLALKGKLNKRLLSFTLPLSFFLALSCVWGGQLQNHAALFFDLKNLFALIGLWALCFFLLCHLFVNVPNWLKAKNRCRR